MTDMTPFATRRTRDAVLRRLPVDRHGEPRTITIHPAARDWATCLIGTAIIIGVVLL